MGTSKFESKGAATAKTTRVPARHPPTIVRSDPGKGRTDIALNVSATLVFSEPIDSKSVNSTSVYLLEGGNRVSGIVVFGENPWTIKFVPQKPLDAQSSYELVVTPAIRDLDGDALEGGYRAQFVTGTLRDSPCPGYADPSNCPPFPTGGSGTISGVVSERTSDGLRPLAGVTVFAWVDLGDHGYARGGTRVDAAGRFSVALLPNATIMLQGFLAGYDQPCAVTVSLGGSATADIELVSRDHPLPDLATVSPAIKGVVYEMTPTGKQPVAGARIYIDQMMDLISATTTTDENGRYAVCRIPTFGWGQTVYAVKDGYQMAQIWPLPDGTPDREVDIELSH